MTPTRFKERIRTSIANEALQIALDNNAQRRVNGRIAAFASLPDWKERRQRAHAVRADVISHLDEYLNQFIAKVSGNGIIVHRAKDAAEAVKTVLEIVNRVGADGHPPLPKLIAKSKSMVSEEIELNHFLGAAGHRVAETDLGEYIVQLRGEKPAHIITPAVHLRRHQVGQLFHEKLGIPYTEDIPTLTNTARKVLREVFLTADVGISGVNFGVAETGTLCIVTNEGNGRMVTTMPPIHIALMGMERIVPTLDDLALMLSLLPRSATGQKITVYTQLIHSPRRADELDGARERHLVIVDNGRSRLQHSALQEALYCIRCGACLNACPVFRELGGHAYVGDDDSIAPYPGPIGSIVSPGLLGLEQFGHLAQASSLCGACKDACPVDIDLPKLLTRVRAGNPSSKKQNERHDGIGLSFMSRIGLHAYGVIASSPRLFRLSQKLAGIGTRIVSPFSQWLWIPSFTGWGYSKDFPRFATKTFRERFHREDTKGAEIFSKKKEERIEEEPSKVQSANGVGRFTEELTALGGNVYRVSKAELNDKLIEFLKSRNIDAALMWDQVEGVDEVRLTEAGVRAVRSVDPTLKAGITGAVSAIAETGTLVIPSGKGQPLSASLLSETHIAVVKSSQVVLSLEEALLRNEVRDASAVALVTGPSRTADIEMTLTIGVHGPKELHVFVVDG
ncbi:MAG: LUD domain-containing protein [Chloroflexi bacterium]|nr:LUD domain-containing protein [Chloroflexota bacterium]